MVTTGKDSIQAILQGKCTECGSSDDNYKVIGNSHKSSSVLYEVVCDCGIESTVRITTDGLSSDDTVSYEEASWHQSDSSGELDEEDSDQEEPEEEGLSRDSDKQV